MLALLTQHFSRVVVLADYMANMERYKKDCVNKAKPILHCNGKCQVKMKLEAHDREEERRPSSQKLSETDYVLSSKSFFPDIISTINHSLTTCFVHDNMFISSFSVSIFHPPIILV